MSRIISALPGLLLTALLLAIWEIACRALAVPVYFLPPPSAVAIALVENAPVLAGSALGNRAIARQVSKAGGGPWPTAFLGDEGAMVFWQELRTRIERPAAPGEAASATRAAEDVFAHFLAVPEAPEGLPA